MGESKLAIPIKLWKTVASYNVSSVVLMCQYMPSLGHILIQSCCHHSVGVFTSRYDSTLLGHAFSLHQRCFAWDDTYSHAYWYIKSLMSTMKMRYQQSK